MRAGKNRNYRIACCKNDFNCLPQQIWASYCNNRFVCVSTPWPLTLKFARGKLFTSTSNFATFYSKAHDKCTQWMIMGIRLWTNVLFLSEENALALVITMTGRGLLSLIALFFPVLTRWRNAQGVRLVIRWCRVWGGSRGGSRGPRTPERGSWTPLPKWRKQHLLSSVLFNST